MCATSNAAKYLAKRDRAIQRAYLRHLRRTHVSERAKVPQPCAVSKSKNASTTKLVSALSGLGLDEDLEGEGWGLAADKRAGSVEIDIRISEQACHLPDRTVVG
jgi:hypothetical protein